ncbi:epiplakin-like, partial [Meleagris gallopavo]|uniref:epiplakin-like n=1 Tax=Meleagris gallopavo TaxID=9103 RepID=UPI0012AB48B2
LALLVQEAVERSSKVTFRGLRRQVTASDLLDSGIINKDTLADLVQGSKTVEQVTQMASVKRYLDGTGCIAGVLVPSKADPAKTEKTSIYQAMRKGILRQGTALVLLEAQAATGFLIDPLTNQKLSVDEAVSSGLVGSELHEKLLSAERAVTGYTDPYSGAQISLFQAMQKELIVREHGVRLLEAQIATGGIIDPVHSHRIPVEAAYERGLFDEEMNRILSDPSDDTKGFFDPNTHENLTYMQLLRRCVPDPDTGLLMLQLMDKGSVLYQLSEDARRALQTARTSVSAGLFQGQSVTLWELLFSRYVPDRRRQDLLREYKAGTLTLDQLANLLALLVQEAVERSSKVTFRGLRRQVTASDLLDSGIIDKDTLADLVQGSKTVEQVTQMASVKRYLDGTGCIAGVLVPSKADPAKTEKTSIYQAMRKGILRQGTALVLLEAQAATGFIIDPVKNQKLSVDEAVSSGLVGSELHEKLLSAERAVTGYTDPYSGAQISLFQAMQKELIVREHGVRLLEAQIATGGIIDPVHSHRIPVEAAYERGLFDEEMNRILSDPSDDTKGFFDPNTHENLTYMQLLHRCVPDPDTGLYFLKIFAKSAKPRAAQQPERGEQGLCSLCAPCPKQAAAAFLLRNRSRSSQKPKIRGSRRPSSSSEDSERGQVVRAASCFPLGCHGASLRSHHENGSGTRVSPGLFFPSCQTNTVPHGSRTVAQRQKMSGALQDNKPSNAAMNPTASKCTEMRGGGSNFIAGVFIQAKNKKLSIYDAMIRGLLTPGTALVLLEAQAASGFLADPMSNAKLSVKEALSAGLIGRDFYEKLLSAEGAVSGYTEPYTGHKISLFQAMQKEFIVKEHAIRLLEAQIATGGIIDPTTGDRLPVEVAQQRGYFDREMCQFLLNPKNQTRSCFDPNTHENLTYTQLLRRCVPDPDTGLLMLHVMDKGSALFQLNKDARKALQAARTTVSVGLFQGSSSVTVWELLFSRYVSDHQREELLRKYKAGTVTIPEMIIILTTIITGVETGSGDLDSSTETADGEIGESQPVQDTRSQEQQLRKSLKSATIYVTAGEFQGQNVSLLDLLFSTCVPQEKRQELLELYRAGILSTEQVAAAVSTVINKTEAANITPTANAGNPQNAVSRAEENGDGCSAQDNVLKSTTIDIPAGEFSVWDLLFSDYIPEDKRQELLVLYHGRVLTLEQVITAVTTLIKKKESTGRKFQITVKHSSKDTVPAAGEKDDDSSKEEPRETALKTTLVDMEVGEFRGHKVSVWDLLHSKYIPAENRKELLELYQAGELTLEQVKTVVSTIVAKTEAAEAEESANVSGPRAEMTVTEAEHTHHLQDRTWEKILKSTTVEMAVDEFQGRRVSVWDLLSSDCLPEDKRQELLELFRDGTLTTEELIRAISSTVTHSKERHLAALPQQTVDLLQSEGSYITFGQFQEQRVSVWELLSTKQVSEYKREACLDIYGTGGLTVNKITITTTVVTGTQGKKRQHQDP